MTIEKGLLTGSTAMLILKLLESEDMYGYQMIEALARRSDKTFELKSGTLYPLLHLLEKDGLICSYEVTEDMPRPRKYYRLRSKGREELQKKESEWRLFSNAVEQVLRGGEAVADS